MAARQSYTVNCTMRRDCRNQRSDSVSVTHPRIAWLIFSRSSNKIRLEILIVYAFDKEKEIYLHRKSITVNINTGGAWQIVAGR